MTNFLDEMFGFYINDEEQLKRDFIKDNFCPHDEDPFTYESDDVFSAGDEDGGDIYP